MNTVLDYQLFRAGGNAVTVGSLIVGLAILVGAWIVARVVRQAVAQKLFARSNVNAGVRYALGRILGYLIVFLGAMVAIQTIGINVAALTVFGGALGIGIGIGMQDIAKNFVSGLIILIERPVSVGDRIEIGSLTGDVVEVRSRATIVRTNDDVHLIVPNSKLINDTVTNRSYGSRRVRYHVPVSVAYGSDPRKVEAALLAAAAGSPAVLTAPAPTVWFTAFGDSALQFELLCWTDAQLGRPGNFRSELNFLLHDALRARGIEVPFPQREIHIRSLPPMPAAAPTGDAEAAVSASA